MAFTTDNDAASQIMKANQAVLRPLMAPYEGQAYHCCYRSGRIMVWAWIKTEAAIAEVQAGLEGAGLVCTLNHFQMQYTDGPRDQWYLEVVIPEVVVA